MSGGRPTARWPRRRRERRGLGIWRLPRSARTSRSPPSWSGPPVSRRPGGVTPRPRALWSGRRSCRRTARSGPAAPAPPVRRPWPPGRPPGRSTCSDERGGTTVRRRCSVARAASTRTGHAVVRATSPQPSPCSLDEADRIRRRDRRRAAPCSPTPPGHVILLGRSTGSRARRAGRGDADPTTIRSSAPRCSPFWVGDWSCAASRAGSRRLSGGRATRRDARSRAPDPRRCSSSSTALAAAGRRVRACVARERATRRARPGRRSARHAGPTAATSWPTWPTARGLGDARRGHPGSSAGRGRGRSAPDPGLVLTCRARLAAARGVEAESGLAGEAALGLAEAQDLDSGRQLRLCRPRFPRAGPGAGAGGDRPPRARDADRRTRCGSPSTASCRGWPI